MAESAWAVSRGVLWGRSLLRVMRRSRIWLVVVVVGIPSAAAGPADAGSSRVYGGAVSIQGWPLVLSVGDDMINRAVVQWTTQCPGGASFGYHGMLAGHAIGIEGLAGPPQGKLGLYAARIDHNRFRAKLYGTIGLGTDTGGTVSITIGGHISGRSSRGFISGTIQQGGAGPNCYIGPLRWYAQSGPLVYGGTTAQHEPVVAILAPHRDAIAQMYLGWSSGPCRTSPSGYEFSDSLGRLPLSRGRLAAERDADLPFSDGSQERFHYALAGSFSARSAQGSFTASARLIDPAGFEQDSCAESLHEWRSLAR